MRKGTILHYIKAAICVAALLPACTSCVYDSYVDTPTGSDTTVNVGLTIRTSAMTDTRSDGYEKGSTYENYIDLTNNDYRIYFFTNSAVGGNDTFIARFTPTSIVEYGGTNYTEYTLFGTVPADVINYTSFKIMVLANWGATAFASADENITTDTTIDNICSADWSQFSALSTDNFTLDASHLIPFYGIHAYTGITFKPGTAITLPQPITLLRAMAKVEVTLISKEVTLSDVNIQHYNTKGFCAPYNVYSEADYGQGTNWATDYLSGVHLVGGANDAASASNSISLKKVQTADIDNGLYETWVAYLPEYKNTDTDSPNDYSYIQLSVTDGDTYTIYFANYAYGVTDNDDMSYRYDIQRNNLYSYSVEVLNRLDLNVHVNKWDEQYTNDFTFEAEDEEEESEEGDD